MTITKICNILDEGFTFNDVIAAGDDQKLVFKRGRMNIDIGPSGVGKTTFEIQKNILFAIGRPCYELIPLKPTPCIYINTEQRATDIIRRYFRRFKEYIDELDAKYKKLLERNFELIDVTALKNVNPVTNIKNIVSQFRSSRDIDATELIMLTIDPAYAWFADSLGNTKAIKKNILDPLSELSDKQNIAVNLVCHTTKSKAKTLTQNDCQGGHILAGAADSMFGLLKVGDGQRQLTCIKGELDGMTVFIEESDKFYQHLDLPTTVYDNQALRDITKQISSRRLYQMLKEMFPSDCKTKKQVEYVIKILVEAKVLEKIDGKNAYRGLQKVKPMSTEQMVEATNIAAEIEEEAATEVEAYLTKKYSNNK